MLMLIGDIDYVIFRRPDPAAGRNFHGSQVFDHRTDPAGFHVEHYVDGDIVDADDPTLKYPIGRDTMLQWGPAFSGLRPGSSDFADRSFVPGATVSSSDRA
jgi:hypothetical protein